MLAAYAPCARRLQGTSSDCLPSAPRRSFSLVLFGAHPLLPEPLPRLTGCSSSFLSGASLRPLAHSCYPCTDAAVAVAPLPDVFSTTSSPSARAFRRNALICFSFIRASYSS